MSNELHPNSHRVTIFRAGTFLSRAQSKESQAYFAQSKEPIGSYYESKNSIKVGSGLNFTEENILLPNIIDCPPADSQFRKKVTEFYIDITTPVPYETGMTLEIGLLEDNSKALSDKNMPINIMDYVRYRHAIGHPHVAKTKEEGLGNKLKSFYVFDSENVQAKNKKLTGEKDAAVTYYLKIKDDKDLVDMALTLLGRDPRSFEGKEKEALKRDFLRDIADNKPADLIRIKDEADMEVKAWIKSMENTGVIKKLGGKYIDGETNEMVANSLEELVSIFKDEERSGDVVMWKARLQEALLTPLPKTHKQTQV